MLFRDSISACLRYLFNAGLVTDRREGLWLYYRISVAPGSREGKQLQVLQEMLAAAPEVQVIQNKLQEWLKAKATAAEKEARCVC